MVALAVARLHPILALLQALLCHCWLAYKANRAEHRQAAQQTSSSECSLDVQCTAQQHSQYPNIVQQQQQQHLKGQDQQQLQMEEHCPQQRQPALQDQHHTQAEDLQHMQAQQMHQQEGTAGLSELGSSHAPVQTASEQTGAASRGQGGLHSIQIKLVICCGLMAALPFVAWIKQPRQHRRPAAWADAISAAMIALHATVPVVMVSL